MPPRTLPPSSSSSSPLTNGNAHVDTELSGRSAHDCSTMSSKQPQSKPAPNPDSNGHLTSAPQVAPMSDPSPQNMVHGVGNYDSGGSMMTSSNYWSNGMNHPYGYSSLPPLLSPPPSMNGMMGMGMGLGGANMGLGLGFGGSNYGYGYGGNGPLHSINQFLFSFQSIVFSMGQAMQIIGMNTKHLHQLYQQIMNMLDQTLAIIEEVKRMEEGKENKQLSPEEIKRRRRLKAIRWSIMIGITYLGSKAILKWFQRRRVYQSRRLALMQQQYGGDHRV